MDDKIKGSAVLNATEEPEPSTGTYLAEAEDLTAVADAIRLKGGTSAPLTWPEGYVISINNISTGPGWPDGYIKSECITSSNVEVQ